MIGEPPPHELMAPDEPTGGELPKTPEIRSGEEVARIMESVYSILGDDLGCRLIQPNGVLTLAGLKGRADVAHIIELGSDTQDRIEQANQALAATGVQLKLSPKKGTDRYAELYADNQPFLRYQHQRFPAVIERYTAEFGEPNEATQNHLWAGVTLGYPERAAFDVIGHGYGGTKYANIISVHPAAQRYRGAVPEFDYAIEHEGDPEIQAAIRNARAVLKEFYSSNWFQALETSEAFLTARKRATALIESTRRRPEKR